MTTNTNKDWLGKEIEGKITKVDPAGYGFITSPDLPFTRIFFHWTALKQNTLHFLKLEKNMRVRFTPVDFYEKGFRAMKITVISPSPDATATEVTEAEQNIGEPTEISEAEQKEQHENQ